MTDAKRSTVLVVEDDALLALDLSQQLEVSGFDVLGPANSVSSALALLRDRHCDAGVLDIHLGRETSEAIAHALLASGIPFITVSGYSRSQRPPVFDGAPLLSKPLRVSALVTALRDAIAGK